jgi:transcriptional regulator with XRE-family HTH domain
VPTPREQLASILKQARTEAGFDSHLALARRLNVSRPVVSKAENPAQPVPSDALLAAWAGVTGAPLDPLTELARRAKSGTPDWFMPYLAAESAASVLRYWAPLLLPGVFQTEAYARAVLSVERYTAERLAELVATRMERQQVLGRAYVTAIIDHHVLQRCMGSPTIMAEQCAHLITVTERPDIALHVVPEGANVGLWGAFGIAARDGITTVNLHTLRDVSSSATDLADEALQAYELILGAALPRADSLDFVREMESQWKTRASCSGASPATATAGRTPA